MKHTKSGFIELCAQVFSGETGKTYSQINMERVLRGEQQFIIPTNKLKSRNFFPWLLGFVYRNIKDDDLTDYFIYGLNHNWFWREKCNDFDETLRMFLFDVIMEDHDVFSSVSEWYLDFNPNSKLSKDIISVMYGTGLGNIGLSKLLSIKKENENKSK